MPAADKKPRTLYDKVFHDHIVNEQDDGTVLLYIGKHGHGVYLDEHVLTRLQIDISSMRSHLR
jgi:homoaconitase/3-isopropylmalate dehydratase large subunit